MVAHVDPPLVAIRRSAPADATGDLSRHPQDGWVMSDPYPMGARTQRAFLAIIRLICPPAPAPQVEGAHERVMDSSRRLLQYMPALTALGFVIAIHLVDWAPIWTFITPSRLQKLDPRRADDVFARLGESKIALVHTMMIGMRGVILSTWFDQDEVHRALGYEPVGFMRERIALRARLVAGEAATPEDNLGPHSKGAAS